MDGTISISVEDAATISFAISVTCSFPFCTRWFTITVLFNKRYSYCLIEYNFKINLIYAATLAEGNFGTNEF